MVKIDFEFQSKYGVFKDAIWLPDGHTLSDAEIEAMKEQRFNNWLAIIEAPSSETSADAIEQ